MAIRSSVLLGSTNLMAMGHPFAGPTDPIHPVSHLPIGGVPIMIDIRTREVIVIDPWLLKDARVISSAFGIVLGPKGHGKSSFMKILANRLCLLTAGYDMMRIAINDYKPEGSASEYELFTKHMRSEVFKIASMKTNPFEARLFVADDDSLHELAILRVAEVLLEYENAAPLIGDNAEALRVGVSRMLGYDQLLWSPFLLFDCLREISDDDITNYNNDLKGRLRSQMARRLELVGDPEVTRSLEPQMHSIVDGGGNLRYDDIKKAGVYLSTLLGNILHGSFGSMFGVEHSMYDMLTQRAVTNDWRGVPPAGETLLRIIRTQIKIAAIENNRLDLLPHIELDDEFHKSMGDLLLARSHSHFSEIARGTHTCNLSATHRFRSIRRGAVGSELYNLGSTVIDNLGFAIIGRHEASDPGLDEVCERYDLSRNDRNLLTMLPDYTFGIKLGPKERIRYGRVFALPSELGFLKTDAATDRMIDRPGILYPQQLLRFAEQNGIAYITPQAA
jgi:hypothetical protein